MIFTCVSEKQVYSGFEDLCDKLGLSVDGIIIML